MLRKSNIELLRIFAMFLVVLSHYYNHGNFPVDSIISINKVGMQLLASAGKIAVDVFVIISGYFLITAKFSWSKLIKFISCTYFWSLSILLFCICIYGIDSLDIGLVKKSLFPLTPLNWFARAYLHLYIVFPLINWAIEKIGKRYHLILICILTLFFYLIPTINNHLMGGYLNSFFMFIDLYLIGAFIKLYEAPSIKKYFNLLGLVSVCTIFLSIIYFDILGRSNPYYMIKENIMIHAFNGADILALFAAIALFLVFRVCQIFCVNS